MNFKFDESELSEMTRQQKEKNIPVKHALSKQATIEKALNERQPTGATPNAAPMPNVTSNGFGRSV